jgi:hypothetical protein
VNRPRSAWLADLYTFTLVGSGPVLRYTTSDIDVTVPYSPTPLTYDSRTALFDQFASKSYGHWKVGLDVDTWQVVVSPRPGTLIGNQPWLEACCAGALDGALGTVDRVYWDGPPPLNPGLQGGAMRGVVNIFTGLVAPMSGGRSATVLTLNDMRDRLSSSVPRTLYGTGCRFSLFSPGCGLAAAAFAQEGALLAGSTKTGLLSAIAAPGGSGTYSLGRVVFTSGTNAGLSRSVRLWSPGSFTLLRPLPYAPAAGDAFTAYPGCDKGQATCAAFGNNAAQRFGGTPFIPIPETAN